MDIRAPEQQYNPYRIFSREQWARLRDDTPMTLEPGEFSRLRSMHDRLDLKEVEDIYLPLSRLLSIYVDATQRLFYAQRQFLGIQDRKMPYIIGVAGYERYNGDVLLRSVAVTEQWRSAGIGAALTVDRLEHARNAGCSTAYMLTDTARLYWAKHGFEAIERSTAPIGITQSKEWSHACPQSAAAMRRRLPQSGD